MFCSVNKIHHIEVKSNGRHGSHRPAVLLHSSDGFGSFQRSMTPRHRADYGSLRVQSQSAESTFRNTLSSELDTYSL